MVVLIQLAVATAMVAVTIIVHLGGLAGLLLLIRRRPGDGDRRAVHHEVAGILLAAGGLFALHGVEIWGYAALYVLTGAIPAFETALYFSTSTYTTIGYGDVLLPRSWRLVGAIEGANGIILLGWSTAFFVAMVGRIRWVESVMRPRG
jgi:voltage-gated potassium channel